MTSVLSGNPSGFTVLVQVAGVWTDVTQYSTRSKGVPITRAGISNPQTVTVNLWKQGGGLAIDNFAGVRIYDPYMDPGGLYVRYFNGFAQDVLPMYDGSNVNQGLQLRCIGWDWWWDNPPARPTATLTVGMAPQWLANHTYSPGARVTAFPDVGIQYRMTGASEGTSGASQPAGFDGNPGGSGIADNGCTWAADGSSAITDKHIWLEVLPIYFPNGEITYGSNISTLIASVPGFQITPDMAPSDIAKKMASFAGNRSYYAIYNTWHANNVQAVGDEIEFSPSVHGIIFQVQSVTGDAKTAAAPHDSDFTSVTALGTTVVDNHVTWVASRYTGRWEASCELHGGQRIEPQTGAVNGYWYKTLIPGITAATPPGTWTTTIGATFTSGTVTLMCMGLTEIQPVWQMWTPTDNFSHDASWTPDAAWFDANSQSQIIGPEYSDAIPEDTEHLHYGTLTINRLGAGHRNVWYVWGKNASFARVPSQADYDAIGMWISGYYKDDSDTGPADENECFDLGQRLLSASITKETVQVESHQITDPVMIQKLAIGAITSSLLGLGSQQYQAAQVTVTLGLGLPQWKVNFGAGFETGQTDPLQVVLGRPYAVDHTPPNLVTWPANFNPGNSIDCNNHLVTETVQWQEDSADTDHFDMYYVIHGDTNGHWLPIVRYPTTSINIPNLPEGVTLNLYVSATDHFGNVRKNADGSIQYSVSPDITTPTVELPPAPHVSAVASGPEVGGQSTNFLYCYVDITVTKSAIGDDGSGHGHVFVKRTGAPSFSVPIPPDVLIPGVLSTTVRADNLLAGESVVFEPYIADECEDLSPVGPDYNYTIPTPLLAAPGSLTQTVNYYDPDFDKSQVGASWTAPPDPLGLGIVGFHIKVEQTSFYVDKDIALVLGDFEFLLPGVAYDWYVQAIDGYGHRGLTAHISGTTAARIYPTPYNPDFESPEDIIAPQMAKGWTGTNNSGSVTWDATTASSGSHSIKFHWTTGTAPVLTEAYYFYIDPHKTYSMDADEKGSASGATGPSYKLQYFDSSFAHIVGSDVSGNLPAFTTSFATQSAFKNVAPPSNARYGLLSFGPGGSASSTDQWIDNIRLRAQVQANDIAAGAVGALQMGSYAVIPGDTDNGLGLLENGSLEIPTIDGTFAAGWTIDTGTVTYRDIDIVGGAAGDGKRYIRLGGSNGTHRLVGPLMTWAKGRETLLGLCKYSLSASFGVTATNFGLQAYDKNKAFISRSPYTNPATGLGLTWNVGGGFQDQVGSMDPNTGIPANTVYVAFYVEITLSLGTATLDVDDFRIAVGGQNTYAGALYGVNGSGAYTGAVVDLIGGTLTGITNPSDLALAVLKSAFGSRGSLIAGTGAGTVNDHPPGANNTVPMYDSTQTDGIANTALGQAGITTSTTVVNTLTETDLATFTLPANLLKAGMRVRLRATGTLGMKSTPTLTIRAYIGGTLVATQTYSNASTLTGVPWRALFEIACRTTGAGGTCWWYLEAAYNNNASLQDAAPTAAQAIDTTASKIVKITAQWSAALTNNTISCDMAQLEYDKGV